MQNKHIFAYNDTTARRQGTLQLIYRTLGSISALLMAVMTGMVVQVGFFGHHWTLLIWVVLLFVVHVCARNMRAMLRATYGLPLLEWQPRQVSGKEASDLM